MGEKTNKRNQNLLLLVGIVGAVIGIATLFLPWLNVYSSSGIEEYNAVRLAIDFDGNLGNAVVKYIPIIIGVLSLAAIPFHLFAYRGGIVAPVLILGIAIWILSFYYQTMVIGIPDSTDIPNSIYLYYGLGNIYYVIYMAAYLQSMVGIYWIKSKRAV